MKHGFEAFKNLGNLSEAPAPSNLFITLIEWRNVKARLRSGSQTLTRLCRTFTQETLLELYPDAFSRTLPRTLF